MIRLSVFYPTTEGATFDHDYYRDTHVPLCVRTWQPADVAVEKGLTGPHVAAVHLTFDSMDALQAAMAVEGTAAVIEDVPNYTSITPVQQLSEVVS